MVLSFESSNSDKGGSLTTLGYAADRKATIDVTNMIWQRASIKSFMLFARPQAAWVDAWNSIVSLLQSGAIKPIVASFLFHLLPLLAGAAIAQNWAGCG